ncbi:hypothetical protein GF327_06100 [Candidatus Woesearchaeota archaeon]|nr:hypothetical protein [Candidatus Woesearchaeota archaeon]
MKLKKSYILIVLFLSVMLVSGCIQQIKDTEKQEGYQAVTIKELINDTTKYDGQKVSVMGEFTDMRGKLIPECVPIGTGENPEIREEYKVYPSVWGISNQHGEIGVDVVDENGVHISTMPDYKEGQEIELKGTIRSTTVADYCDKDIRYKSMYIEVNAKDVDIRLKPLPKILPQDK